MKNTLENKAKFFAQYWDQKVMVNGNSIFEVGYLDDRHPNDYLLLKSIVDITTEHSDYILSHKGSENEDYLRYNGYAIPWMGLTVDEQIEYGWIKLENNR